MYTPFLKNQKEWPMILEEEKKKYIVKIDLEDRIYS